MKHYIAVIAMILSLYVPVQASTNLVEKTLIQKVSDNTSICVETNLNQVITEILTGVKNAGGEIHQASKNAVGQAYDYVKAESPEIIKEFLRWKLLEACIVIAIVAMASCFLFYLSHRMGGYVKELLKNDPRLDRNNSGEYIFGMVGKWMCRIIALVALIVVISVQGMIIGKILVAPRVFIIEYVYNTIKSHRS